MMEPFIKELKPFLSLAVKYNTACVRDCIKWLTEIKTWNELKSGTSTYNCIRWACNTQILPKIFIEDFDEKFKASPTPETHKDLYEELFEKCKSYILSRTQA